MRPNSRYSLRLCSTLSQAHCRNMGRILLADIPIDQIFADVEAAESATAARKLAD